MNRLDFNFFCVYFDSALNFQWFLRVDPILVLFCENVILKSILNEQNQNFSTKWSLKKIRHVFNEETEKKSKVTQVNWDYYLSTKVFLYNKRAEYFFMDYTTKILFPLLSVHPSMIPWWCVHCWVVSGPAITPGLWHYFILKNLFKALGYVVRWCA